MKNVRIILCILSVAVIGCSDDINKPESNSTEELNYITMSHVLQLGTPYNGIMSAMYYEQGNYNYYDYYGRAAVFQNTDPMQKVNAGVATIANNVTNPYSNNEYHNKNEITFGQVVNFGITGNSQNGISAFSEQMYIPQKIHAIIPGGVLQISKSQGMTITWNTDSNNDKGVFIGLDYQIIESNNIDGNMPDEPIITYENVDDNGTYDITPAKLSSYPVGSIIELIAARGNYNYISVNSRTYLLLGYTSYIYKFEVVY
mgnify:FL=1